MRPLMAAAGLLPTFAAGGHRSQASQCGTKADVVPDVQRRFAQLGFEPLADTPTEFSEQIN